MNQIFEFLFSLFLVNLIKGDTPFGNLAGNHELFRVQEVVGRV